MNDAQIRNHKNRLAFEAMGYLELADFAKTNVSVSRALTDRAFRTIDKVSDNPVMRVCLLERILECVDRDI